MKTLIHKYLKEETMMKKQYEQPMAEKIEFNYRETIVASGSDTPGGILKRESGGNNGCWDSNKNGTTGCTPVYD